MLDDGTSSLSGGTDSGAFEWTEGQGGEGTSIGHMATSTMAADVPRVAQWLDEDELDEFSDIQTDLAGITMGSLKTAQAALESEAESETSVSDQDSEIEATTSSKLSIQKRRSKHAPTEISSKRPVSRQRPVVQPLRQQARDPRFLPLAGQFSKEKYRTNYGFLSDTHQTELTTLRENLNRAKKLSSSIPKSGRHEQEEIIRKLELAVKRAESAVNQDKREKVEQEALAKAAREEEAKRKSGKAQWWMKASEKKRLLAQARFEQLNAEGGARAVKKAIAKKQKKVAGKEKKSRPFPNRKRPLEASTEPDSRRKRTRLK